MEAGRSVQPMGVTPQPSMVFTARRQNPATHRPPFPILGARYPNPSQTRPSTSQGQGQPAGPQGNDRRNQPRNQRFNRKPDVEQVDQYTAFKVQVIGFPPYTQAPELARLFSAARVEKLMPRQSYATLVFNTIEEAKHAVSLSKKINIYGEFLIVKPYTGRTCEPQPVNKTVFVRSKQKEAIIEPDKIDLTGEFVEQMERILAKVRLTQEEAAKIGTLYHHVETVLQEQWPGCVAMPFGSITTGLGIKSSDADCFVRINAGRHVRSLQNSEQVVRKAKRLLANYPDLFDEILCIPQANTPIVKFFHLPTETNCDLSFKTPLGSQNSKLISFLLHSDSRLLPMAVLIKYWAKVHGLSGTGKMTNYALTMMIIFYLQQPPISILPSVEWLQRDRAYDVIVDYWNTGFMNQEEQLPPSTNTSSIAELLGGFFEFYAMFDFNEMVVCPFLGRPVKKAQFKDLNELPAEFKIYKHNVLHNLTPPLKFTTMICVQDPFEQSHNVASPITSRLAVDLKAYFKHAADYYEKEKQNDCRDYLRSILLLKPKLIRVKTHPEFRVNIFPRLIVNIVSDDWKGFIRDLVFKVFEDMLQIKLGKVEEKVTLDSKKERERYTAVLTKALWKRKPYMKLYNTMNLEFVAKQKRVSEDILKFEQHVFECQFQLTITYVQDPKSSVIMVKLNNGNLEQFNEFGRFFVSVVQNWFSVLLRPYSKPAGPDTMRDTIKILDRNYQKSQGLDSDDDDNLPQQHRNSQPRQSSPKKQLSAQQKQQSAQQQLESAQQQLESALQQPQSAQQEQSAIQQSDQITPRNDP